VIDFTGLSKVVTAIAFRGKTYSIERLTPNGLLELQEALREIDRPAAAQPLTAIANDILSATEVLNQVRALDAATPPAAPEPLSEWAIVEMVSTWGATKGASLADLIRTVERAHGIGAGAQERA